MIAERVSCIQSLSEICSMLHISKVTPDNVAEVATLVNGKLPYPNLETRAVVTIPVCREYHTGRIASLIDQLSNQSLDPKYYEVILSVNNPGRGEVGHDHDTFSDNRELIDYIDNRHVRHELSNVHLIDATDGSLPLRSIGMARGIANEVGSKRLERTWHADPRIIIQLDADVSVEHNFIEQLLSEYVADPAMDMAFLPKLPLPMDYPSDDMYCGYGIDFLEKIDGYSKGRQLCYGGPTISFRSDIHSLPEMRKYMQFATNEDYQLSASITGDQMPGRYRLLAMPRVVVGDRMRSDGYDAIMRSAFARKRIHPEVARNVLGLLGDLVVRRDDFSISADTFSAVSAKDKLRILKEQLRRPVLHRELDGLYQEELVMADHLLDPSITDRDTVSSGAVFFALGRMILPRIESLLRKRGKGVASNKGC